MKNKNKNWLIALLIFLVIIFFSIIISNYDASDNISGSSINEVSIEQYLELINQEGKKYIYIGYPECPYCVKIEPSLQLVAENLAIEISYLNISGLSQEKYNQLIASNDIFKESWGTPLLLVFNGGQLEDYFMGYGEYIEVENFYQKNM